MRAARALMVIDRLLSQLWPATPVKSGRQAITRPVDLAPPASLPDDAGKVTLPAMAAGTTGTPQPNRHQRRLQAAGDRKLRADSDAISAMKPAEPLHRLENSAPDYDPGRPVRQPAAHISSEITA